MFICACSFEQTSDTNKILIADVRKAIQTESLFSIADKDIGKNDNIKLTSIYIFSVLYISLNKCDTTKGKYKQKMTMEC